MSGVRRVGEPDMRRSVFRGCAYPLSAPEHIARADR